MHHLYKKMQMHYRNSYKGILLLRCANVDKRVIFQSFMAHFVEKFSSEILFSMKFLSKRWFPFKLYIPFFSCYILCIALSGGVYWCAFFCIIHRAIKLVHSTTITHYWEMHNTVYLIHCTTLLEYLCLANKQYCFWETQSKLYYMKAGETAHA
jgi:hypothetical protein